MPLRRDAPRLPIDDVLPDVLRALDAAGHAVLVAAPGAGKTTRVPLALLDAPWRGDGRILVLEPRRVAARAAAQRMAWLLHESVGETVGYRVRFEQRIGPSTRLEVVTEGILTRMLRSDPALDGVAALIFDEFHERHLPSDLGLALALESRDVLRPALRILVMSATLDAEPAAALLRRDDGVRTPVIRSVGREHPVETSYRPTPREMPLSRAVAAAVRDARQSHEGDVLVFMPGVADLQRVERELAQESADAETVLLHGGLALEEQDRVLRPRSDAPRIILSTAIAESSVTVDGVRVVIDSGYARVPRYDPRSGMSRLETVRVSRASADQRRGRAGRLGPGVCIRLWDEAQQGSLMDRSTPEILETDLTALALELACAGITDASALRWLDPPPAGALGQGQAVLREIRAIDTHGRVTPHGRAMADLGVAPRLAHLVLEGARRGASTLACELAALLGDRDPLPHVAAEQDADIATRVRMLREGARTEGSRTQLTRLRTEVRALRAALGRDASDDNDDLALIGPLVASAYPDRIAQRRSGEEPRYRLASGRGARLALPQPLGASPFLAVANVDGRVPESRIYLAATMSEGDVREIVGKELISERFLRWDDGAERVRATCRERYGALALGERVDPDVSAEDIAFALLGALMRRGIDSLPWTPESRALRARLAFAHRHGGAGFPPMDDFSLRSNADEWLLPALIGARRLADVTRISLAEALLSRLDWSARARLDAVAPSHIDVPSGSRIRVSYDDPEQPALAVKLQECFGWMDTPRVAEGRVPLALHLLSPAGRPVQVTKDLASFWRRGYFEVRRDLRGRYPRHPWPDDPLTAVPTRRVKPRGT